MIIPTLLIKKRFYLLEIAYYYTYSTIYECKSVLQFVIFNVNLIIKNIKDLAINKEKNYYQ